MKKVLALVVAFALCFTAVAGCFAVSATTPTIAIANTNVAAAGGSATITVTGTDYTEQYAQILAITIPQEIEVVDIDDLDEYDSEDPTADFDWVRTVDGSGDTVVKILDILDDDFTYTINVIVPANATASAVEYTISAEVDAADWQTETLADITIADATVTVAAAHVHAADQNAEWLTDGTNHWHLCAAGDEAIVDQAAHTYGAGVVTAPTCTAGGYTTYTCTVCGYSYTDNATAALGHNYVAGAVTAPTCTEGGYTTYTCSRCGDSYQGDATEATGHSLGAWTDDENGHHIRECANCDYYECEAHDMDAGVVTPPTCTEGGYTTYSCTVCDYSYTADATAATGHQHTEIRNAVAATCVAAGYTGDTYCTDCNTKIADGEVIAATGEHNYENGVCTVCGAEEPSAEIPVIGTLQLARNILARDSLGVRIKVSPSQVASYDSYYVEVVSQHFRTDNNVPYSLVQDTDLFTYVAPGDEVPEGYNAQAEVDANHNFDYTGITAFEMTLPMQITLYVCNGGAVVGKSQTYEFSIASRIKASYIKNKASDAVFIDMLNYGAVVQRYFANLNPTSDLAAYEIYPDDELDQTYATSSEVASVNVSAVNVNANVSQPINTANAAVGKGMQIANKNNIKYLINTASYEDTTLRVTYEDSYGEDHSVEVDESDWEINGKYFNYFYDKVALYDTHVSVVASLYNATGDLLCTRTYSVASYFYETKTDATILPIGDALMKFTYSLRINLGLD